MNKHNAKEFLPLVQALADGKTIQHQCKDDGIWFDSEPCYFNLDPQRYRIKPEPREWTLEAWKISPTFTILKGNQSPREIIRVREILD